MMREGFQISAQVFDAGEVDDFTRRLDAAPLTRSRAGVRHLLRFEPVSQLGRDSRMMQLAAAALGGTPFLFGATLFDKSPDANWLVSWHQDTALPLAERRDRAGWGPWSAKDGVIYAHAPAAALEQVVALRLHLDDSTASNGPLRVLPGTHRSGVLSDAQVHAEARRTISTSCVAARGDVLMMHPLLIHASSKAVSGAPRRVVHFEYSSTREFPGGMRLPNENGLSTPVDSPFALSALRSGSIQVPA